MTYCRIGFYRSGINLVCAIIYHANNEGQWNIVLRIEKTHDVLVAIPHSSGCWVNIEWRRDFLINEICQMVKLGWCGSLIRLLRRRCEVGTVLQKFASVGPGMGSF